MALEGAELGLNTVVTKLEVPASKKIKNVCSARHQSL
jgi:hypothetical protein